MILEVSELIQAEEETKQRNAGIELYYAYDHGARHEFWTTDHPLIEAEYFLYQHDTDILRIPHNPLKLSQAE